MFGQTFSHTNYPPARLNVYLASGRLRLAQEGEMRHAAAAAARRSPLLECISRRQLSILLFLATATQIGFRPTLQEIADRHGVHKNLVNTDLRRLRALGLVRPRDKAHYRSYQLSEEI